MVDVDVAMALARGAGAVVGVASCELEFLYRCTGAPAYGLRGITWCLFLHVPGLYPVPVPVPVQ